MKEEIMSECRSNSAVKEVWFNMRESSVRSRKMNWSEDVLLVSYKIAATEFCQLSLSWYSYLAKSLIDYWNSKDKKQHLSFLMASFSPWSIVYYTARWGGGGLGIAVGKKGSLGTY